jgi:hypothetical protein
MRTVIHSRRLGFVALLIAGCLLSMTSWAGQTSGSAAPGYDRVGKNIVGGMRGSQEGVMSAPAPARDAGLHARKSDLTKRMFWIMLSLR